MSFSYKVFYSYKVFISYNIKDIFYVRPDHQTLNDFSNESDEHCTRPIGLSFTLLANTNNDI